MLHFYLDEESSNGRHFGVSSNEHWILVQLDDGVNQVRVELTPAQAREMVELLQIHTLVAEGPNTSR